MDQKYIICIKLHALGDIIGNHSYSNDTLEKVYEFINLGGITNIDIRGWNVSDVTITHMNTANALLEYNKDNSIDTLKKIIIKYYDEKKSPNGGIIASGSLCIGLLFPYENDRHKLIQIAIECTRFTNCSVISYLGAMTSALFASLAVEGININEWPHILLELFESGIVNKYIKTSGMGETEYLRDSPIFIEKWHRYIEDKFDDKHKVIHRKSEENLVYRSKYYYETFRNYDGGFARGMARMVDKHITPEDNHQKINVGSNGDDSVIIAYDCLIDCDGIWEKLVYYSMLHVGAGNITGSLASGLYGLVYGSDDVEKHLLKDFKYKGELEKIGKGLHKKANM
jgi:ADP-ribosylarginine hydrolase